MPSEPRPPGHTCPAIDEVKSVLRKVAWRARQPEVDRTAVLALVKEGSVLLEQVRAENAQMREAYHHMKKQTEKANG